MEKSRSYFLTFIQSTRYLNKFYPIYRPARRSHLSSREDTNPLEIAFSPLSSPSPLSNISFSLINASLSLFKQAISSNFLFFILFLFSLRHSSKLLEKTSDSVIKAAKTGDLGLVRIHAELFFLLSISSQDKGNTTRKWDEMGSFCLLKKMSNNQKLSASSTLEWNSFRPILNFICWRSHIFHSILISFPSHSVERAPSARLFTALDWSDGLDGTSSCVTLWT